MLTWFCTGTALVHKGRSNLSYTPPSGGGSGFGASFGSTFGV